MSNTMLLILACSSVWTVPNWCDERAAQEYAYQSNAASAECEDAYRAARCASDNAEKIAMCWTEVLATKHACEKQATRDAQARSDAVRQACEQLKR